MMSTRWMVHACMPATTSSCSPFSFFSIKKYWYFSYLSRTMCYGYILEVPWQDSWAPQHKFLGIIKNNMHLESLLCIPDMVFSNFCKSYLTPLIWPVGRVKRKTLMCIQYISCRGGHIFALSRHWLYRWLTSRTWPLTSVYVRSDADGKNSWRWHLLLWKKTTTKNPLQMLFFFFFFFAFKLVLIKI